MLTVRARGLASAFGPTRSNVVTAIQDDRTALFANPSQIDAAFNKQICAFRDREAVGCFEARVAALADEAVRDLLSTNSVESGPTWDVALVLPEPDQGLAIQRLQAAADGMLRVAVEALGEAGIAVSTRVNMRPYGHAAVGWCLADRLYRPAEPTAPLLVIAADSYSDRARLRMLDDGGRLFSDRNPYGLVPGEMGGALLLTSDGDSDVRGEHIAAASATREPVPETTEAETLFQALSDASLAALTAMDVGAVDAWFTDWNNGRYRASEFAYTAIRVSDFLAPGLEPTHPSLLLGDVGAASGLVPIVLGDTLQPTLRSCLVTSGSFSGLRSAFVCRRYLSATPADQEGRRIL